MPHIWLPERAVSVESQTPGQSKYHELISDIKSGVIRIPKFQRDFVWTRQQSAELIDSMLKGYPIGTLIFWRTQETLQGERRIGDVDLGKSHEGGFVQYVLDGQQRLTSLFAIMEDATMDKNGKKVSYRDIFVDLDGDSDDIVSADKPPGESITVYDLLHKGFDQMTREYSKHAEKITRFQNSINNYQFSTITIKGYPIDKAVDMFSRINTKGKILTLFDIMVAKTFEDGSFDLRDRHTQLQNSLSASSYDIPEAQIMQCVSVNLRTDCKRKTILDLSRDEVKSEWGDVASAIKKAVDHFKTSHRIPSGDLLPYPALMVPFAYFFRKNKTDPTAHQVAHLKEYFWRAALTSRFTSAVDSKLAADCRLMDEVMGGKRPEYGKEFKVGISAEDIQKLQFKPNDAIGKAVLCALASAGPQSFKNGTDVILDGVGLSKSNSRNYHHFFPKAFLQKKGFGRDMINLTANITLIGADLNKNEIGAKAPSEYMESFSKDNPNIEDIMKTHMIDDLAEYGVWEDDYEKFVKARSERIWRELRSGFEPDIS